MLTWLSLFSGGGVAESLLHEIDVQPIFGVEYDAKIAAVYRANYGDHIAVADVSTFAMATLPDADIHWYSPVCKEFSTAKTNGKEGANELAQADACARAIRARQPRYVFVENVPAYVGSKSLKIIRAALDECGYWSTLDICNTADYGVPQTRKRMLLRAVSGGMFQPYRPLPAKTRWIGWYAAISDLVDTLPETTFAPWQIPLLPADVRSMLFGSERNGDKRDRLNLSHDAAPAFTVTAANGRKLRAFVCDGQANKYSETLTLRHAAQPMYTVTASNEKRPARAFLVGGANTSAVQSNEGVGISYPSEPTRCVNASNSHNWRAYLVPGANDFRAQPEEAPAITVSGNGTRMRAYTQRGRIVKITPRALARFQSLPDTYVLPETVTLAGTVIGNGAPSEWVRRVVKATIEQ